LAALAVSQTAVSGGFEMRSYYEVHPHASLNNFLAAFPFRDYLGDVSIRNFRTLEADRTFLCERLHDGDPFLYAVGDYYVAHVPLQPNIGSLTARAELGIAYLSPKSGLNRDADELYQRMGYFFLGTVARAIEDRIKRNQFDAGEPRNAALIRRLEQHHVFVTIEESPFRKLLAQVRNGRVTYAIGRTGLFLFDLRRWFGPALAAASGAGMALALMAGRRGWKAATLLLGCVVLLSSSGKVAPGARIATWRLSSQDEYPKADAAVGIFKLRDAGGKEIGSAVWLFPPHAAAHYLAYRDVYERYMEMRRQQQVILATTGGFTNAAAQPEGLTTEAGTVVNAVLMHDRHGLVLLHNGELQVLNLKDGPFRLPGTEAPISSPLESLAGYSKLLTWARQNDATMFQTQLLAFNGRMTIDERRAKPQLRERRVLVLARELSTQQVEHVIFDVETPCLLADAAREICSVVAARGRKVEAAVNLDTGAYNILQVYGPDGGAAAPPSPVTIRKATNLIVYSK
jgi:hypothetical protein